jgi:hypothetical protein
VLLDRPGYLFSKNEIGPLMPKSCKDPEDIKAPIDIVKQVLNTLQYIDILELYEIPDYEDVNGFLTNLAKKYKYLLKVIFYLFRKGI